MQKHTAEAHTRRKIATNQMSVDELTSLLLTIQKRLRVVQQDVDRLTLRERIDSLAARVAELEAKNS